MQIPHSYCDISAQSQTGPAPRTGTAPLWDKKEVFGRFLEAMRKKREEDEDDAIEDALKETIDAMNESEEEQRARGRSQSMSMLQSLQEASEAISEKFKGKVDPMQFPQVQAIMACLRDSTFFGPIDEAKEQEQEHEETEEEATEERGPDETRQM